MDSHTTSPCSSVPSFMLLTSALIGDICQKKEWFQICQFIFLMEHTGIVYRYFLVKNIFTHLHSYCVTLSCHLVPGLLYSHAVTLSSNGWVKWFPVVRFSPQLQIRLLTKSHMWDYSWTTFYIVLQWLCGLADTQQNVLYARWLKQGVEIIAVCNYVSMHNECSSFFLTLIQSGHHDLCN